MGSRSMLRSIQKRSAEVMQYGFDAMARYPYDLGEMPWDGLYLGDDTSPAGFGNPDASRPASGRTIKLVPPPASQRYQAQRPRRIPLRLPSFK